MKPRALVACLLLAASFGSQAHTLSVAHLDITVPADGSDLQVELDLALRDVALTLPLDANRDERVTWGELLAVRDPLQSMLRSGLTLSSNGGPCVLSTLGLATRRYDDGGYATLRLSAHCPSHRGLHVDYRLLFDNDPQHRALVTVRRGATVSTGIARVGATQLDFSSSGGNPFLDFVREGIHHILRGYDHLAFLVSLLLPAALIRVQAHWKPSESRRSSLMHVLGIVTAFTLAHSITLSLAALGWVTPASRWVEVSIAASVLLAALNNIWPLVERRVWLVAFGFGLIHGFGFAGALLELGLPSGARLLALIGFNVGVELGQLAVVALLLPLLFALRRRRWYPQWLMWPVSAAIAVLATTWLVVRLGAF